MNSFKNYNQRLTPRAKENRCTPTVAEKKLWYEVLCGDQTGYRFLRQKPIDHFILDFYCSKLRLCVEVDGDSHAGKKEYDEERTQILEGHGIAVVRYTNDDVMKNVDGANEDLMKKIGEREKEMGGNTRL